MAIYRLPLGPPFAPGWPSPARRILSARIDAGGHADDLLRVDAFQTASLAGMAGGVDGFRRARGRLDRWSLAPSIPGWSGGSGALHRCRCTCCSAQPMCPVRRRCRCKCCTLRPENFNLFFDAKDGFFKSHIQAVLQITAAPWRVAAASEGRAQSRQNQTGRRKYRRNRNLR